MLSMPKNYSKDFDWNFTLTQRGKRTDFIFTGEEGEAPKSEDP